MESAIHKRCVILRRGEEYVVFRTQDIAYLYYEKRNSFLVDIRNGAEYAVGGTLSHIYEMLDRTDFYRVNKNYIVCIRAIVSLKTFDINKLELMLDPPAKEPVFISQLRISDFKDWIERSRELAREN